MKKRIDETKQQVLMNYEKLDYTTRVKLLEKMREANEARQKMKKMELQINGALLYVELNMMTEQTSESNENVDLYTEEAEWTGFCDECALGIDQSSGWKCRLCRRAFCYDRTCQDCDCLYKLDKNFSELLDTCMKCK